MASAMPADLRALALVLRAVGKGGAQGDEEDGFLLGGVHGVLPGWTRIRVEADSPGSMAFDNPCGFAGRLLALGWPEKPEPTTPGGTMIAHPARAAGAALALCLCSPPSPRPDYPSRTITMIVPFPPGGVADITGRPVAEVMGRHLKQTVIVENSLGAGGGVGMQYVARAKPDGYTRRHGALLGLHHPGGRQDPRRSPCTSSTSWCRSRASPPTPPCLRCGPTARGRA